MIWIGRSNRFSAHISCHSYLIIIVVPLQVGEDVQRYYDLLNILWKYIQSNNYFCVLLSYDIYIDFRESSLSWRVIAECKFKSDFILIEFTVYKFYNPRFETVQPLVLEFSNIWKNIIYQRWIIPNKKPWIWHLEKIGGWIKDKTMKTVHIQHFYNLTWYSSTTTATTHHVQRKRPYTLNFRFYVSLSTFLCA